MQKPPEKQQTCRNRVSNQDEERRKDGKFKETSSVVIVSERAGEHCQTKRVLSQHQSSFLPRQLGRATSLTPSLPPSLLPGFLTLAHPYAPPQCTHVCALPPSPYKSGLLHAIFCSLHFLSLLSVISSLPSSNQLLQRRFWKKSVGLGLCLSRCVNWVRRNGTCRLLHPSTVDQKPRCTGNQ